MGVGACSQRELEPTRDHLPGALAPLAAPIEAPSPSAAAACDRRVRRLLAESAIPREATVNPARASVLASAKAEPAVFVREPRADPQRGSVARAHALSLEASRRPHKRLARMLPALRANPALGREVLLREGYLWADAPELAAALVDQIAPHHLFDAARIWIQRGERLSWAARDMKGSYVWEDGPERGRAVRLILFDRLGVGVPPPALHRDLRALRYRLHFERAKLRNVDDDRMVADLRYGGDWVPTLLRSDGARLELDCEAPAASRAAAIAETRMREARRERALRAVRRSLLAQIEKARAFEPPVGDKGSPGGGKRPSWRWVERSMFGSLRGLLELTEQETDWFEAHAPSAAERIPIGELGRLTTELTENADDYASGDVVVMQGATTNEAFFVYENDPLTGLPIAIVGGGERPTIRVWRAESTRTPERVIERRIRPKLEWLESIVPALEEPALIPPPLVAGPTPE